MLPACSTDGDGAVEVFAWVGDGLPRLVRVWADGVDRARLSRIKRAWQWVLDIVTRCAGVVGFEVQPWRWVVERTFGWFNRYRRLSKDYEHNPKSSEAWIYVAMIHRMSRASLPDKNADHDLLRRPNKRRRRT